MTDSTLGEAAQAEDLLVRIDKIEAAISDSRGVVPVAEDAQAETVDAAFVARDQLTEGPGVASQVGGEQGLVGRVGHDVSVTFATPPRNLPPPSCDRLVNQISR